MKTHQHNFEIVESKAEHNKGTMWYMCKTCYFTKPLDGIKCQCGEVFDKISIVKHIEIEQKLGNYKQHHYSKPEVIR